jgi:beta-lactamase superfamily II metal-dependent hydrolase
MRVSLLALVLSVFLAGVLVQAKPARHNLKIYFIDVEGGAATLIVTPAGESVLMDAGWDTPDGRDAKRIQQAMQLAGITTIDHLVVSHYHRDHYGDVPELSRLVPVKHFYDHGKMSALSEDAQFEQRYGAYQAATKGASITLKPGDAIPLKTSAGSPPITLLCVAANAAVIAGKMKPNPECGPAAEKTADSSENGRSVALLLSWGKFDFLNVADLTPAVSAGLICPANQIGEVDLYQATHHGGNLANYPRLLRSLSPTVTVIVNGPRKGGHVDTLKSLQALSAFKAVYQLHRNVEITAEQNAPVEFIANLEEQPDEGNLVAVEVDAGKKTFTVTNARTKASQIYQLK